MNAAHLTLSLVLTSCAVALAAPSRANAGWFDRRDDCAPGTRHARAETAAELCNAKRFESLNCAELAGYAESYRMRINQQIASTYYRPVAELPAEAGVLPHLSPDLVPAPSLSEPSAPEPTSSDKPGKPSKFRRPANPSRSEKIQSTFAQPRTDVFRAGP